MPWPFILPFIPCINSVVSLVKFDISVFITNINFSCAFSPFAAAVIRAVGLSKKIVVATHHSIAFFSPLGILKTYSGVHIKIPYDALIIFLKSAIDSGGLFIDKSGSKCGSSFRSLKIVNLKGLSVMPPR